MECASFQSCNVCAVLCRYRQHRFRKRLANIVTAVRVAFDADVPTCDRKKAAQILGQCGGKSRVKVLSVERRKEIAKKMGGSALEPRPSLIFGVSRRGCG